METTQEQDNNEVPLTATLLASQGSQGAADDVSVRLSSFALEQPF